MQLFASLAALSGVEKAVCALASALVLVFLVSLLDTIGVFPTFSRAIGGGGYSLSSTYRAARQDAKMAASERAPAAPAAEQ